MVFLAKIGARLGWLCLFGAGLVLFFASMASADTAEFVPSSEIPLDVNVSRFGHFNKKDDADNKADILEAQVDFDQFAWKVFLALNWPANSDGSPKGGDDKDSSKNYLKYLSDVKSPRVWKGWRTAESIFLPFGKRPDDIWDPSTALRDDKGFYRAKSAWRAHASAVENSQAFSGPLVDQNGNWVRYEVMVNEAEFNYIVTNKLFSQDGQVEFSQSPTANTVNFPLNDDKNSGAIEIKLAWKELGKGDESDRFYHTRVKVLLSEPMDPGSKEPPSKVIEAGLVGMHIAMRTRSAPEWIWATFEQADNLTKSFVHDGYKGSPNFLPYPNATLDKVTGALRPADGTDASTWIESRTKDPVQVVRPEVPTQPGLNPLDADISGVAAQVNDQAHKILKGSVFANYNLIDVQWPVHPNAPAFAGGEGTAPESIAHKVPGDIVPVFLVNSIMETYFMKGDQFAGPQEQDDRLASDAPPIDHTRVFATESCAGCHYSAGITIGFKRDKNGQEILDPAGRPIAIYGENSHFGQSGNGQFSWLLQMEAKATRRAMARAVVTKVSNPAAEFIDRGVDSGATPGKP